MSVTMVYDIETVPDLESGRRVLSLSSEISEKEVLEALLERRRKQTEGSEFLPHYLHKVVAISVVVSTSDWVKVWSLGEPHAEERDIIERFFAGIEHYSPTLVSWNGSGFDLPVLHYRALVLGVVSPKYWETGEKDNGFKWNNYLSRYHQRHTDIMDVIAGYQSRAFAPLTEIALMLGLPGKMGMDGSKVLDKYQSGEIHSIRNYCETDVLNTYLIYLRFQNIRGVITTETYEYEKTRLRKYLKFSEKPHFLEFLEAWKMGEKENVE